MATQDTMDRETPNDAAIAGREMFTMVESRDAMKVESARIKRTRFCSRPERAFWSSIENLQPSFYDIYLGFRDTAVCRNLHPLINRFLGTPGPASPLKRKSVPGTYPANTRSQSITMISNAMRRITTHSRKFECWILTSSDSIE